jgi:hypothetical protein
VRYVIYLNRLAEGPLKDAQGDVLPDPQTGAPFYDPVRWGPAGQPPFLEPVFSNGEVTVYRVVPEAL